MARVTGTQSNTNFASMVIFVAVPSATVLHSVVTAPGTTNITPLTDLIVGILSGQAPATWFAASTNGALSSLITPTALADALNKFKATLVTLPGKLALPDGFDPLSSQFSAKKGDTGDDFLEAYRAALTATGLSQTEAATRASARPRHWRATTRCPFPIRTVEPSRSTAAPASTAISPPSLG